MRKFVLSILSVFYLMSATGITIQLHYCMGQLADWDLGRKESKACGSCGMEKAAPDKNDCCKDEHKFVKNNTDQKTVESAFQLMEVMGTLLLPVHPELPSVRVTSLTEENPVCNAPPRSSVAVYILNRTFLI